MRGIWNLKMMSGITENLKLATALILLGSDSIWLFMFAVAFKGCYLGIVKIIINSIFDSYKFAAICTLYIHRYDYGRPFYKSPQIEIWNSARLTLWGEVFLKIVLKQQICLKAEFIRQHNFI